MALKDIDPSEEYPYIFMTSQNIQQRVPSFADDPAEYFLTVTVQFYKITGNKVLIDPSGQVTVDIDDFTTLAMTHAYAGDMTHANTLGSQQLSVKAIIEEETGRSFEVL